MMQWSELRFVLIKNDGTTLELGGTKYPMKKDNELFNSLLTFESKEVERKMTIEVYISHADDISIFNSFFELPNSSITYKMQIFFNGSVYNASFVVDDKPIEVTKIEDLYGTKTQPTATVKMNFILPNQFFYSDFGYDYEIGFSSASYFQYPLPYRLKNNDEHFIINYKNKIISHTIDNTGNEDNGIFITIISYQPLINPTFYNETTGLSMTLSLTTGINDVVKINTIDKTIYLNDKLINNSKDLFDKWFQLIDGKNVISFDAEAGAEYAHVEVKFYNKYRALK